MRQGAGVLLGKLRRCVHPCPSLHRRLDALRRPQRPALGSDHTLLLLHGAVPSSQPPEPSPTLRPQALPCAEVTTTCEETPACCCKATTCQATTGKATAACEATSAQDWLIVNQLPNYHYGYRYC